MRSYSPMSCSAEAGYGASVALTELTFQRHARWSWTKPSGYAFARAWRIAPLTASECLLAATCFPIVFSSSGLPYALLRLAEEGVSPFVGSSGQWQAPLLPEILKCFPFGLADWEKVDPKLAVFEESALVQPVCGTMPIFIDGELPVFAQEFSVIAATLQRRARSLVDTHIAGGALRDLELMKPFASLGGFSIVDQEALANLSEIKVQKLWSSKALGLLYAGAVSLTNVSWMERAEGLMSQLSVQQRQQGTVKPASGSGFLSALSSAHHAEEQKMRSWGQTG